MASKPDNGLRRLSTFSLVSSRPWWEKILFPRRAQKRMAKRLLRLFEIGFYRNFSTHELVRDMGIDGIDGQCLVDEALRRLLLKGKIEQLYPGKFRLRDFCRVTGVVDLSLPHKPALISGNSKLPIYILPDYLYGASHGDTVQVKVRPGGVMSLEAEVLRIVKFAQRRLVGNLEVLEHKAFFTPTDRDLFRDIEIPLGRIKDAESGDRVLIELDLHTQGNRRLTGKVVKVIGETGSEYVELLSNVEMHGFAIGFTREEEEAAAAINGEIGEAEIARRVDMRGVPTFTIDPEGTKDIDDALSVRTLENGRLEIGIHIADVTHYVKPTSVLDRRASKYTTSLYMADRVLPLFPDRVTEICSLLPGKDRLAFSLIVEVDSSAKIVKRKLVKTVIRSQHQYSYGEAQWILDGLPDTFAGEMKALYGVSEKLRKARIANGAIAFEARPNLRFEFDSMGHTTNVTLDRRLRSMMMIEEFMLLANGQVADIAVKKQLPFIYRVHSRPREKMFDELCRVAGNYGYLMNVQTSRSMAASMSSLLRRVAHRPEESLFNSLCIRSMSRGKYSIVPRSHFAMAVDNYTHFTSPIRRYVDMVVHRLLTQAVVNDDSMSQTGIVPYATACTYFNDMRDRARALQDISERQKSADFLRKKIGEEFMATITHVTPALMTVEMDRTGITGRVLLNTLIDDQYRLDYNTYVISGLKTGNCYRIGHRVRVRVSSVSVHRGIIDFTIVSREKVKGRWK